MNDRTTPAATADDQRIIQATFESAADTIGEMVTGALQKGFALAELAVVVERRFDGKVVAGCARRADLARRFRSDARLVDEARRTIAQAFDEAAADELPIVVLVHGEGYVAVGVRRERGSFMAVS